MPEIEAVLITEPPPLFSISGIANFPPRKTDLTLTAITRSQSATSRSTTLPGSRVPALLYITSSPPYSCTHVLIRELTESESDTSTSMAMAWPPFSLMKLATSSAFRLRMSATTTAAPSSANRFELAAPMPEPPPVTIDTLSFSNILIP